MSDSSKNINIPIFITDEQDCPYFSEKRSVTSFVDPMFELSDHHYQKLSELGFRRSGEHLYRPVCSHCQECIATRLDAGKFSFKRRFKRVLSQNKDIKIQHVTNINNDEYYALYELYINSRHRNGSMFPASREQYRQFLICSWSKSQFLEFRLDGELVAVAVTDDFPGSLSAVYTFYSPRYPQRSLGTLAILTQLQQTRLQHKQFLYLGYWVKNSTTMDYKGQFRPIECFINDEWQELI